MTKNTSQKKVAKTIEETEALGLTEIEVMVSQETYDKLNELKRPGESYSDCQAPENVSRLDRSGLR